MIWADASSFGAFVDNFGATYSNTGLGVSATAGAANTKGSNTNLLNGIAFDCYFLQICFLGGDTSAATKRYMVDILTDPAAGAGNAGTTWGTIINNLVANSPNFGPGYGQWYGFPLFIPAGSAIGCAVQCSTASATIRTAIRIFGKPSRPELLRTGAKVQTLGATTGTTVGTTVTPGSSGAIGSYSASLGTLNQNSFWLQCGILSNDTAMTACSYRFDVAVDTTSKYVVMDGMPYIVHGSAEQASKSANGRGPSSYSAPSGAAVFVRGTASNGVPDTSMSAVVYAVQ